MHWQRLRKLDELVKLYVNENDDDFVCHVNVFDDIFGRFEFLSNDLVGIHALDLYHEHDDFLLHYLLLQLYTEKARLLDRREGHVVRGGIGLDTAAVRHQLL